MPFRLFLVKSIVLSLRKRLVHGHTRPVLAVFKKLWVPCSVFTECRSRRPAGRGRRPTAAHLVPSIRILGKSNINLTSRNTDLDCYVPCPSYRERCMKRYRDRVGRECQSPRECTRILPKQRVQGVPGHGDLVPNETCLHPTVHIINTAFAMVYIHIDPPPSSVFLPSPHTF